MGKPVGFKICPDTAKKEERLGCRPAELKWELAIGGQSISKAI